MTADKEPLKRVTHFDELQAWLESVNDRQVISAFAARNALRSLPATMQMTQIKTTNYLRSELTLATLRANLYCCVVGAGPKSDKGLTLETPARLAIEAADSAMTDSASLAARAASYAAAHAVRATSISAFNAKRSVTYTGDAAEIAADETNSKAKAAAYFAAYRDAEKLFALSGKDLLNLPLWPDKNPVPVWHADGRNFSKRDGSDDHWDFWRRWYQGFLDQNLMDWELQRRVALRVSEKAWTAGVEEVAKRISKIEAEYLLEKTRLNEELYLDDQTKKVTRRPRPPGRPVALPTLLQALRDDLDDLAAGNLLPRGCYEFRVLDRMLSKYDKQPDRIEMDVVKVLGLVQKQISEGTLPAGEPALLGLCTSLDAVKHDIYAKYPDIREARAQRMAEAVRGADPGEIEGAKEALEVLPELVEEELAEEIIEDLEEVVEASENGQTPDSDAVMRSGNRLGKIWLILSKAVAGSGIGAAAVIAVNEALPILQGLWQLMARLLGIG